MYVESERLEGGDLPVLGGRTKPSCPRRTAAGENDDAGFGLFVTPCDCEYRRRCDRGVIINERERERCSVLLINVLLPQRCHSPFKDFGDTLQ